MAQTQLALNNKKNILILASHIDNETLDCDATIAKHIDMSDDIFVATLTLIEDGQPLM